MDSVEEVLTRTLRSENPKLAEMCAYVMASGGKRIRPAICILSNLACGGKDKALAIDVGAAFEITHSATLIHDDINDQGDLRRGHRALYKQYSISSSIIAGDYMFAKGFQLLSHASQNVMDLVVEAASAMGESEIVQNGFEHAPEVTESDYIGIIRGKTAMIIYAAAKSGSFIAGASLDTMNAIGEFAMKLGLAFQIIDDTLDVIGEPGNTGKRVGIDLIEGKPTLPVIYAMEDPVNGIRVKEVFSRKDVSDSDVSDALAAIRSTDSINRCKALAESYMSDAMTALSSIPDSVYKDALIDFADFIISRDR